MNFQQDVQKLKETYPDRHSAMLPALRAVECLGGCGWATIVAVDDHYRTHVKADDVPAIVEELTSGD